MLAKSLLLGRTLTRQANPAFFPLGTILYKPLLFLSDLLCPIFLLLNHEKLFLYLQDLVLYVFDK